MGSSRPLSLLEPACAPTLIPDLTAGLSQLSAPLREYRVLEADKVAMFDVVRIGKAPWESAAHDTRFVAVWADDAHWQVWGLILIVGAVDGSRHVRR